MQPPPLGANTSLVVPDPQQPWHEAEQNARHDAGSRAGAWGTQGESSWQPPWIIPTRSIQSNTWLRTECPKIKISGVLWPRIVVPPPLLGTGHARGNTRRALALAHHLRERGLRVWKLQVPQQGESPGGAAHTHSLAAAALQAVTSTAASNEAAG